MTDIKKYRLKDFINNDLKVFSNLDNVRSIPSIIDGFKDSQRKAVYGLLNFAPQTEKIKVDTLGGIVILNTDYLHGAVSMQQTIVKLAQNYPGSNNVNLFEPIGQFGTILSDAAAAPRYIHTKPSANMRKYINKLDDLILEYRKVAGEEENTFEPLFYLPVLPMWLVNGSDGIGTGHASNILPRDPAKVLALAKKLVQGVSVQQRTIDDAMMPYFIGWKGKVEAGEKPGQWKTTGIIEKVNSTTLLITELPVGYDNDKFKSILTSLMDEGKVKDWDNDSTEKGFRFEVSVPREIARKSEEELIKLFKLTKGFGENVTLWGSDLRIRRYTDVYEAFLEFLNFRSGFYQDRKDAVLKKLSDDMEWLNARRLFIEFWNETPNVHKHKRDHLKELMLKDIPTVKVEYHDRLLSLQISTLTPEKIQEHSEQIDKLQKEIDKVSATTIEQMYIEDLDSAR